MVTDSVVPSNQRAVQRLARDILARGPGDRIPTSLHWQELLGVGSGTVQKGLRVLENAGAVELRPRGHQGTFIVSRHVGRLWSIGGLGHVTGALPLPDSLEGSGLATGLRDQFDRLGIPLQMLYLHGASNRVRTLEEARADFAVLSRGAGEHAQHAHGGARWIAVELGPNTYYSLGSIVVLRHPVAGVRPAGAQRVGIDRTSYDHEQLSLAEFPEDHGVEFVPMDYPRLPAAVGGGEIDAAVWHRTLLPIPLELINIEVAALSRPAAIAICEALSPAILLASPERPEVVAALRELDIAAIREMQGRVLRNEILPVF